MEDLRCLCGKIVSQFEGNCIVIKCRHCKRYLVIKTKGIHREEKGRFNPTAG
ncbi:hypothetical protein [Calderihabitans maritimus]|uniref:Com family DNA-binding transcriptional regulator n=1 Tax=Calderihabitans maritimus TaxID=1246530 RepID=A0A1Z5HPJ4_9FIRM|nr:hypothetical protein [Calderihabitans maritimus]GAW91443.1 hypothetical protein CHY_0353 [Calderihabitans maritimus]